MSLPITTRTALALAAAALLAACGGGEAPRSAAQTFSDALASTPAPARSDRLRALAGGGGSTAAAAGPISNVQLFQGAEAIFPALFPTSPAPTTINNLPYDGKVFQVKAYANGNYLGIANDGTLWGLGPYTNGALTSFGAVQSYADQVCGAINCGGSSGGGSLNGCTMPASEALRVGNRYDATYVNNVFSPVASSGEYSVSGVVEASTTFEGQSAFRVNSRITGTQGGTTIDATNLSFEQIAENELTRSLGGETQAAVSGFNLTIRTVFAPPTLNTEFTLQPGASLSKSVTATTTYIGAPLPPSSGTSTTSYTYEARESISVLGRSYDTCRYKQQSEDSSFIQYVWYIVGRGLPAREESRNAGGTVVERSDLKSATINGAPL